MRRRISLLAALLFTLSCGDLPTEPLTPGGLEPDINVEAARITLHMSFGGQGLSELMPTGVCTGQFQLYVDGAYSRGFCQNADTVTVEVKPGDVPVTVRSWGRTEVAAATVPATAGATTVVPFDLAESMALVTGSLEVDGATPVWHQYRLCDGSGGCTYPGFAGGGLGIFTDTGEVKLAVVAGSSNADLWTATDTVAAGDVVSLGAVSLTPARIRVSAVYDGAPVGDVALGMGYCQFQIYLNGRPARSICNGDEPVLEVAEGDVAVRVYSNGWSTPAEATVSAAAGDTVDHVVDVTERMGLVTGTLRVNGEVPALNSYRVCASFGCLIPTAGGTFSYLEPAGSRSATVRPSSSNSAIGSVSYDVTAGETTALDTVAVGLGVVQLTLEYEGTPLSELSLGRYQYYNAFDGNQYLAGLRNDFSTAFIGLPSLAHTLRIRMQNGQVIDSVTVTPSPGDTTAVAVELSDELGMVSGRLLINDVPAGAFDYQICIQNGPCIYTEADGIFRYLDLPGARTAYVRGSSSATRISEFGYTVVEGLTTIVGTVTGGAQGETGTGTGVSVTPVDAATGASPAALLFGTVTRAGQTTVSTNGQGPPRPAGTRPGTPEVYYYIATTAEYSGMIRVCINYDAEYGRENRLALFHGREDGTWENITTSLDTDANIICGEVASLSPFYVAEVGDPPSAAISAPDAGDEGSPLAFDGSGSADPDGTVVGWAWDLDGDGDVDATGATVSHAFPQDGSYTVSLEVTDSDGGTATAEHTVVIANVAPTVSVSGPAEVMLEGGTAEAALQVDITDPGSDAHAATATCGNGAAATGALPTLTCAWDAPGAYTVEVTVSDGAAEATGTHEVTVLSPNRPPAASFDGPGTGLEGQPLAFTATATDPDGDALAYGWDFDADGTIDAETANAEHAFPDNGTYTVRLTVSDGQLSDEATATVVVENVAPTATLALPAGDTDEGGTFTVSVVDVADPSTADVSAGFEYAFDCGGGMGAFGTAASATCPAVNDPAAAVRAAVRDRDGGTSEYAGDAAVANVAPSVAALAGPAGPVRVGTPFAVDAPFTDPGVLDSHTAVVDFDADGAGAPVTGTVAGGAASATHAYARAGLYAVRAAVTDDAGDEGASPALRYVVAYDPAGGFLTGGGWFTSPAGACRIAGCGDDGRARLTVEVRYRPGDTAPSGELQLSLDRLRFRSTGFEWLVVAEDHAYLRGTATMEGATYGFMVTAYDDPSKGRGSTDRVRVTVWEIGADGSEGAVVYESQVGGDTAATADPALPLGGGSLQIHR